MTGLRLAVAAIGVALLAVVVWASLNSGDLHGNLLQQGGVLLALPWGAATLADLVSGFVFMAIIMVLAERSMVSGLLWAAPILLLGNIWTAVWLLIRLPSLAERLNRPNWPGNS